MLAGLVSFFSPCVVPLLPGYLSYVTGVGVQDLDTARRGRLLLGSSLFVLGFTVVFVSGGALFGSIGQELFAYHRELSIVTGVLVILLGLVFMGFVPLLQREVRIHAVPTVGLAIAPVLGLSSSGSAGCPASAHPRGRAHAGEQRGDGGRAAPC